MMAQARRKRPTSLQAICEDRLCRLLHKPRLKDLGWYYTVGQTVQKMFPQQEGRQYGESRIEKIADAVEDHQDHYSRAPLTHLLWSAREFATKFSESEAKRLAEQKPSGYRLTWTHVKYLLGVEDDQRKKLQKKCVQQEWSTGRLLTEVKSLRGGERNAGGRRPPVPATQGAALVQIADMAERWVRWYEVLREPPKEPAAKTSVSLEDLPDSVAERLEVVVRAIGRLQSVTQKAQEDAAALTW
jgi:hypothetical protein